jgi:hypothetical protein
MQRLLAPEALEGIETASTADVRRLRAGCEAAEEAISYVRRLLQGRLDILRAELARRSSDAAGDLLAALPSILSADAVATDPLQARATRLRVPPAVAELQAALDALVDEADLDRLDQRDDEALIALVRGLAAEEQRLSELRRALFVRIDALRDELADRYKDGRAEVRHLLDGH